MPWYSPTIPIPKKLRQGYCRVENCPVAQRETMIQKKNKPEKNLGNT